MQILLRPFSFFPGELCHNRKHDISHDYPTTNMIRFRLKTNTIRSVFTAALLLRKQTTQADNSWTCRLGIRSMRLRFAVMSDPVKAIFTCVIYLMERNKKSSERTVRNYEIVGRNVNQLIMGDKVSYAIFSRLEEKQSPHTCRCEIGRRFEAGIRGP